MSEVSSASSSPDPPLAALARHQAAARAKGVREFQVVLAVLPPPVPDEPPRAVLMAPDTLVAHEGDVVSLCCRHAGPGDHVLHVEGHAHADVPGDETTRVAFAAGGPGAYAVSVDGVDAGRLLVLPRSSPCPAVGARARARDAAKG